MVTQSERQHVRVPSRRHRGLIGGLLGLVIAVLAASPAGASSGGRRVTDAENTRTVYLVVTALIVLAGALAAFTWWYWRSTRRDHEALAPLEVMGEKRFVTGDPIVRQTLLDANRPVGAQPLVAGALEPLLLIDEDEPEIVGAATTVTDLAASATGEPQAAVVSAGDEADESEGSSKAAESDPTVALVVVDLEPEAGATEPGATEAGETPPDAETAAEAGEDATADVSAKEAVVVGSVNGPASSADIADPPVVDAPTKLIDPAELSAPADGGGPLLIVAADHREDKPSAETPAAVTNGANAPVSMIDPGLPIVTTEAPATKQLSLGELASLDAGFAQDPDDEGLTSTPSTGIPVVESAEAWVERQLSGGSSTDPA